MAEYWKSLPRKFCVVCKCWFADNKASIQFHERGKRHQENAQKRIQDIQKRGIKEYKKQKELEDDMAKIEKAALAAYQRDLAGDNSNSSTVKFSNSNYLEPSAKAVKSSLETVQKKLSENFKVKSEEPPPPETPPTATKVWYEAETEEGYKYYWNTEDSESQWEPPAEGYVSLEEQKKQTGTETILEEPIKAEENTSEPKEDEDSSESKDDEDSSESKDDEDSSESKEVGDTSESKEDENKAKCKKDENNLKSKKGEDCLKSEKVKNSLKSKKDEAGSESKEDKDSSEPQDKLKNDPVSSSIGPQPKVDPYGQWVTVEKEEPVEYDLQLPEQSENLVPVFISLHKDGPTLKFKEKVVGQLSDSEPGEVTFKKRKLGGAFKRNARQRTMDDD